MNWMKSSFLGSTSGLVFLSAVLLVAISLNRAHAQGDEGQGPGHGHAIAQNGDAEAKPQPWPQFKATTSTPLYSLYDALGRPDNFTIKGSIRSRGEGLVNSSARRLPRGTTIWPRPSPTFSPSTISAR